MFKQTQSTHYSFATSPLLMDKWSTKVAKNIVKLCKKSGMSPVLFGSGISGITSITAISQKLEKRLSIHYGYVFIRKGNDRNHNFTDCETYFDCVDVDNSLWIFVDDFVDSRTTLKKNVKFVLNSFSGYNIKFPFDKDNSILCYLQGAGELWNVQSPRISSDKKVIIDVPSCAVSSRAVCGYNPNADLKAAVNIIRKKRTT